MHEMNIIKTLSFVENVMGVHRNYLFLKGSVKFCIKIRIVIESCLHLAAFIYTVLSIFEGFWFDEFDSVTFVFTIIYNLFATINTLAAIFLSFFNSNHFQEFIFNVRAIYVMYEDVATYRSLIKNQRRRFYLRMVLFSVTMTSITMTYVIDSLLPVTSVTFLIVFIFQMGLYHRYVYENFVFVELTEFIDLPLKYLNESISAVVTKLNSQDDLVDDEVLCEIGSDLERCGKATQFLVTATDRFRDFFGVQITISICSATIYCISLLYQGISFIIIGNILIAASLRSTLFELTCYILMKILMVNAGQRAENEAIILNKNLCALNNLLLGRGEAARCARVAAGLTRRLRAAPLRVRLLSSLTVEMTLLADIFAVIANYTIVLLQFNHVV